jgi:hypothetical protein
MAKGDLLKPCPFCGRQFRARVGSEGGGCPPGESQFECPGCGANGPFSYGGLHIRNPTSGAHKASDCPACIACDEAWNKRATPGVK